MKLPHRKKRLKRVLLLCFVSCFAFELAAQSSGSILLIPKAGKDVTIDEAKTIAADVRSVLMEKNYKFLGDPDELAKIAAKKQKLGIMDDNATIQEIGNTYKSVNVMMTCTLDKLSAQFYKIDCPLYHKIKNEKGEDYWESVEKSGYVKDGNSLPDLSKKIRSVDKEKESLFARIEIEEKISKSSCRFVSGGFFARRISSCANSQSSKELYSTCFDTPIDTACFAANKTESCTDTCRTNAVALLVYLFIQQQLEKLQQEIISCNAKGDYYSYNVEKKSCEYVNPNEVAEKEAKAKKECDAKAPDYHWISPKCKLTDAAVIRLKKECEKEGRTWQGEYCSNPPVPDHDGSASWLIPGLGLVLKNRPIWGFLCFAATGWGVSDAYSKVQTYKHAKEEYRSVVPIPLPINLGFAGQFIYYDYRYKEFQQAAKEADTATDLAILIYSIQIAMSLTMSADSHFLSSLEQENKKTLTYNFNVKRDSSFGVPNSNGALYTFSLNWRF